MVRRLLPLGFAAALAALVVPGLWLLRERPTPSAPAKAEVWGFRGVLLDTAGRYTTQDSDQAVDSAAWSGFLQLLRKHRRRR